MGIRYYAYPVDPRQYEFALQAPRAFIGGDPLMDAWGPAEDKPDMLYLDKCWRYLQEIFSTPASAPDRPSHLLVVGEVTMTEMGWYSFVAARSPDEVAEIADDIEKLGRAHVDAYFADGGHLQFNSTISKEADYVMHFLEEAKAFTRRLADSGRGLVYQIG